MLPFLAFFLGYTPETTEPTKIQRFLVSFRSIFWAVDLCCQLAILFMFDLSIVYHPTEDLVDRCGRLYCFSILIIHLIYNLYIVCHKKLFNRLHRLFMKIPHLSWTNREKNSNNKIRFLLWVSYMITILLFLLGNQSYNLSFWIGSFCGTMLILTYYLLFTVYELYLQYAVSYFEEITATIPENEYEISSTEKSLRRLCRFFGLIHNYYGPIIFFLLLASAVQTIIGIYLILVLKRLPVILIGVSMSLVGFLNCYYFTFRPSRYYKIVSKYTLQ